MYILRFYTYIVACDCCFCLTNHGFDFAYFGSIHFSCLFLSHEFTYTITEFVVAFGLESEHRSYLVHHEEIAHHILIAYSNVSGSFVGYMYVVLLVDKTFQCATH